MLTSMLQQSQSYKELSIPNQAMQTTLAQQFEKSSDNLFCSPEELSHTLGIGTISNWERFLALEPVQNYIKSQMTNISQVASRKAFQALSEKAASGDTQAAKQINEISGLLAKADSNRVIVLTHVPRPNKEKNNASDT